MPGSQSALGLANDSDFVTGSQLAQFISAALPSFDFDSATMSTTAAGRVTIPNKLGDANAKYVWVISDQPHPGYYVMWVSTTTTTITLQARQLSDQSAVPGGATISLFWIGAV